MNILFIALGIVVYTYFAIVRGKSSDYRFNVATSKRLKQVHFVGVLICIGAWLIFEHFDLKIRGFWTIRIIIVMTILVGLTYSLLADNEILNNLEKWYFKIFTFTPAALGVLSLVAPFVGVVLVITWSGLLMNPIREVYYEDHELRVYSQFAGVFAPRTIRIDKKGLILDKRLLKDHIIGFDTDSISVKYDSDSTRVVFYELNYSLKTRDKLSVKSISLERVK